MQNVLPVNGKREVALNEPDSVVVVVSRDVRNVLSHCPLQKLKSWKSKEVPLDEIKRGNHVLLRKA